MASLVERNGRYCVVYSYKDKTGKRRQKWETYKTMQEAKKRKKEIEYRADVGQMVVPHCKKRKGIDGGVYYFIRKRGLGFVYIFFKCEYDQ